MEAPQGCLLAVFVGFFAFGFGIGFFAGKQEGCKAEKEAAIAAHVAEWRVDAKTGQTTFHYLNK